MGISKPVAHFERNMIMLSGKKTYIVALLAALMAGAQAMGYDIPTWVYAILGAAGLGTQRLALAKVEDKR